MPNCAMRRLTLYILRGYEKYNNFETKSKFDWQVDGIAGKGESISSRKQAVGIRRI